MLRSLLITVALVGCTDDAGTITSTVYGEEYIEDAIPADVFADGWAVQFDRFLISIGDPRAKAGERGEEVGDPGMYLVDLAQPSGGDGHELASYPAPGGTYDHYGYRIAPSADAVAVNATPADATAMKQAGYSMWVQGTATRGDTTKRIDWGFRMSLTYSHCEADTVVDGNAVTLQSTIHADHLFYDDATSPEPEVAFQLIADADGRTGFTADGTITLDELAATDIRSQTRYQVGSSRDPSGAAIVNLRQYVELQATTLGHINGEGHCANVAVLP